VKSVYRQNRRAIVKKIWERNEILKELGLVGASGSKLSGSVSPEIPTAAEYIHRVTVPSAPSASGPPNSFVSKLSSEGVEVKRTKGTQRLQKTGSLQRDTQCFSYLLPSRIAVRKNRTLSLLNLICKALPILVGPRGSHAFVIAFWEGEFPLISRRTHQKKY